MRLLIAALAGLCAAAFAPSAHAQSAWDGAGGRLQFVAPQGWPVDVMSRPNDTTFEVAIGDAAKECRLFAVPRAETAERSAADVNRAFAVPFAAEQWTQLALGFRFFENEAVLQTAAVDETGPFPRQTAQFMSNGRTVYATVVGRPGAEIYGFCQAYDGPDQPAAFQALLASIGTGQDAALAATLPAAAPAEAPPLAPAPQ